MKTVSKKLLSLLLVAFLLVSAIPFQAFAVPHDDNHPFYCVVRDQFYHDTYCSDPNCDSYSPSTPVGVPTVHQYVNFDGNNDGVCNLCGFQCGTSTNPHIYNFNGDNDNLCDRCGMACSGHNMVVTSPYVAPTCTNPGQNATTQCPICGMTEVGATIPALGHNFVGQVCTGCGMTAPTVTLNPYPGTINGGQATASYILVNGVYLVNLPTPDARADYNFVGWLTANGQLIYPNSTANVTYDPAMGTTFTAQWANKTRHVEVYAVMNGDYSRPISGCVWQGDAPENGSLYNFLRDNVTSIVDQYVAGFQGYTWDGYYRDRLGNELSSAASNQSQNIYINMTSVPYTLYFDADGGTVTPTSKTVYRYATIGTMPTPYKEGMVFLGWQETTTGQTFTENTVYPFASNSMVKAIWKEQAKVYLRVYLNGNFNTPDRLLEVDSFVVGDHISWSTIDTYLRRYYSPAPGSTMVVNGLFDKTTWNSYRANPNQERKSDIRVAANSGTEIYVMINGVGTGTTVLPTNPTTPTNPTNTTPSGGFWVRDPNGNLTWYPAGSQLPTGNGYWVYDNGGNPNIWVITGTPTNPTVPTYIYIGSNPKTGDTAQLEIAAAVMVLAAAALITVMALRKKKSV